MRTDQDEEDLDLDSRRLCPDESCIGVLDDGGTCKVCGRGDATAGADVAPTRPRPTGGDGSEESVRPLAVEESASPESPAGWDDRQLCPDGNCVGVLGSDGRCKVCGKAAEGA